MLRQGVAVRTMQFGHPGDDGLGERLLRAVLSGEKTATSSLVVEHLAGEPLPRVGERFRLVDHSGRGHGVVETTRVVVLPMSEVGDDVAAAEGEGFAGAADWRAAHVSFWDGVAAHVRAACGDPDWVLREHEPVVVEHFRLVDEDDEADDRPADGRQACSTSSTTSTPPTSASQ